MMTKLFTMLIEAIVPDDTKKTIRKKVWEYMENNNIAIFPRPVYFRIPNFKGREEAAKKLLELEIFQNSKFIEVNPDKPQEPARILVLEQGKALYVPVPRLKEGLLKHITVPENASKPQIRSAVSRRGLDEKGKLINIDDKINLDLLVVGSVAVSKLGQRIGKGRGYADLEYAILKEMKAVDDSTVIVTLVHDCQVFEEIPSNLFQPFDVPVDYIITPTQIIEVKTSLSRPPGIIWNLLSKRRLNVMPVLKLLKEKVEKEGVDTTLKEVDTDVEEFKDLPNSYFRRRRSRLRPKRRSVSQADGENKENERKSRPQKHRFFKRTKVFRSNDRQERQINGEVKHENEQQSHSNNNNKNFRVKHFRNKPKPPIDFSLMVTNIEKTVRIRELKNALMESGIKPNDITWRGGKGFCYLHYAKMNGKKNDSIEPRQIDNVIETLKNLKIKPDCDSQLEVTIMDRISRIETTDVTAV
ncbi:methenyltetrahydrofolate synthase domain-containing protein isoform X2 [Agrilus planipennis]|uniref:Methenyltetrahydrofolate synthase domain-containing protein n=1 Tax=Agrilus planipennis TaxID=224129 RepID=A0A1W4WL70_AGRPL|nr:methenyltetrahydrofolate synthase domain-containing protein isoform X2 [Agrilus planipennis]